MALREEIINSIKGHTFLSGYDNTLHCPKNQTLSGFKVNTARLAAKTLMDIWRVRRGRNPCRYDMPE